MESEDALMLAVTHDDDEREDGENGESMGMAATHVRGADTTAATAVTAVTGQPPFNKDAVMAVAAPIKSVHRSWSVFDAHLKTYAQETHQLYVVRTTTSVKLRNQRIMEQAAASKGTTTIPTTASTASDEQEETKHDHAEDDRDGDDSGDSNNQKSSHLLIPAHWQWYSKTLMCTHGWKDRNRGTGKRVMAMARSTGCPVKMCVTLQHRNGKHSESDGDGDDNDNVNGNGGDWHVVVTRHIRTHNHPLSKELYLFYTENRRIYDPELLALVGAGDSMPSSTSERDVDGDGDGATTASGGSLAVFATGDNGGRLAAQSVSEYELPTGDYAAASSPSISNPILTLTTPTAFHSWAHFHTVLTEYSIATQFQFRIRSTISVISKNTKLREQAAKAGKSEEEIAVHLVPETLKWYSKLLICDHGWKRKSRSKSLQFRQLREDVEEAGVRAGMSSACPAMFMVRVQRDVRNDWRIVVFRKVLDHNHSCLELEPPSASAVSVADDDEEEIAAAVSAANTAEAGAPFHDEMMAQREHDDAMVAGIVHGSQMDASSSAMYAVDRYDDEAEKRGEHSDDFVATTVEQLNTLPMTEPLEPSNVSEAVAAVKSILHANHHHDQELATRQAHAPRNGPRPVNVVTEVVVRVPKIEDVHESWEAFHACLQQYSEATYQLYRTRTTSSVKGRNQKILEMRAANHTNTDTNTQRIAHEDGEGGGTSASDMTRLIPEQFKWYSKTLTCTHGWKERRRGSGKRTVHIVRSTLCPVKICATLQYLESGDDKGWRIIVTKHIVDHNHNLSRALYLHYCDNRRIYDPQLLAIGQPSAPASTVAAMARDSTFSGATAADGVADLLDHHECTSENQQQQYQQQQSMYRPNQTAITFDHVDSFDGDQHTLPDSAYIASNSGLPSHHQALLPFAPQMMANASMLGHHQLFGQSQGFLNASALSFSAAMANVPASQPTAASAMNVQSKSVAAHVLCQVHGTSAMGYMPNDLPSNPFAVRPECTCLGVSVVQQYGPAASTTMATPVVDGDVSAPGSRRRAATSPDASSASKRPRFEANGAVVDEEESGGNQPITARGPPEGITPLWSQDNPVKAVSFTDEDGTKIWRAPRLKRRHTDWATFTAFLDAYSVATYQLYRIRTTSSIHARNTRIAQQIQREQSGDGGGDTTAVLDEPRGHDDEGDGDAEDGDDEMASLSLVKTLQLIPTSYEWYSKTYVCTHGWKERRRGKGHRVSHNLRSTACPVKLCVTLQRNPHGPADWNVVVTKQVTDHNHMISSSVFERYSENRRIKDPALLTRAEEMWREGQPRRKIYEFLKGTAGSRIVMKDIHNLVQRWQQQRLGGGGAVDRELLTQPTAAADASLGSVDATVAVNSDAMGGLVV